MDNTKKYILMSEKAVELQKYRNHLDYGDYFSSNGKGWGISTSYHLDDRRTRIWLPRQDQLQEMVEVLYISIGGESFLMDYFYNFYKPAMGKELYRIMSMEQLWLTFVMKEKYNKIWTGADWEEIRK